MTVNNHYKPSHQIRDYSQIKFLISIPKHMLWVLNGKVLFSINSPVLMLGKENDHSFRHKTSCLSGTMIQVFTVL